MKNEDLIEERQYDAEYEEHLREVDIVKARAEDHWDAFHKYDKLPTHGKQEFIDGFIAGWFQKAGQV